MDILTHFALSIVIKLEDVIPRKLYGKSDACFIENKGLSELFQSM